MRKNKKPEETAKIVIIITNRSRSFLNGVLGTTWLNDKSAIFPKIVLSPILITSPLPTPSLQIVPKKHKFFETMGLSILVHSTVRI